MKSIQFLPVILLSAGFILFSSCSDNNIVNIHNLQPQIRGKVVDENGLPLYPVRIILNSGKSANANTDGTFAISGVTFPYDLTAYRQGDNVYVCYKKLSTSAPLVYMVGYPNPINQNTAVLYVSYPKITEAGKFAKVAFISKEYSYTSFGTYPNDSTAEIDVKWSGLQTISGRIIYLTGTAANITRILTYDKFGYKDTTLQSGENVYIYFNNNPYYYLPPESDVFLYFTSFSNNATYSLGLSFDGFNINSNMMFFPFIFADYSSLDLVVPGSLPVSYKIRIETTTDFHPDNSELKEFAYVPLLGSYHTKPKPDFNQVSPGEDTAGVDYSTSFVNNGIKGVYVTKFVQLGEFNYQFTVVSDSCAVRFPDLRNYGVYISSGAPFNWNVTHYEYLQNTDEFASDKKINIMPYSYFRTGLRIFHFK